MSQAIFDLGLEKEKVFYTINTLFDLLKEKQSEIESLKTQNGVLSGRVSELLDERQDLYENNTKFSDEIDSLKAENHGSEIGHEHFVKKLKERHAGEIEDLKEFKAKLDAGWIAIPEEPTDEIIEAMNEFDICHDYSDMDGAYRAIIQVIKGE